MAPKAKVLKAPKATKKHLSLHKAAENAVKHLRKLPPHVRKQMGSLSLKDLSYSSKKFHAKVQLPHQSHNQAMWLQAASNPVVRC